MKEQIIEFRKFEGKKKVKCFLCGTKNNGNDSGFISYKHYRSYYICQTCIDKLSCIGKYYGIGIHVPFKKDSVSFIGEIMPGTFITYLKMLRITLAQMVKREFDPIQKFLDENNIPDAGKILKRKSKESALCPEKAPSLR